MKKKLNPFIKKNNLSLTTATKYDLNIKTNFKKSSFISVDNWEKLLIIKLILRIGGLHGTIDFIIVN